MRAESLDRRFARRDRRRAPQLHPFSPLGAALAVIPLFIAAALRGNPPVIFGDGEQTRDVTFVTNVVDANLLACHAPTEEVGGATSVCELWQRIADLLGIEVEPLHDAVPLLSTG